MKIVSDKSREHIILLFIFTCCVAIVTLLGIHQTQNNFTNVVINPVMYFMREGKSNLCTSEFESDVRRKRRRVLSYTIYGSWALKPFWHERISFIANEANKSDLYRDWTVRVYHDDALSVRAQELLLKHHNNLIFCDINTIPTKHDLPDIASMEWRFIPIGDPSVDIMCSRDIDSPLIQREFDAVRQWIESGYYFHQLRDHPQHVEVIMGGLWCARNEQNRTRSDEIFDLILKRHNKKVNNKEPPKMSDQYFLRDHVWPIVQGDIMQHDSFHCELSPFKVAGGLTPYPSPREKNTSAFMGCKRWCNTRTLPPCPIACRPPDHQDWVNC